jgi:hypothetical protein
MPRPCRSACGTDGHAVLVLVHGEHVRAEPHVAAQAVEEGVGQAVHAARHLLHVLERSADDLAQLLDDRGAHVALAEAHEAVELDRALREAALAQERLDRVPPVLLGDGLQCDRAFALVPLAEVARGFVPQLRPAAVALVLGQRERHEAGVALDVGQGHAPPGEVDRRPRALHADGAQLEAEQAAVLERQLVHARDAHTSGLAVQVAREVAQREHAPADAVLRLEHEWLVPLPDELERGHEPRHPGADHDHPLALAAPRVKAGRCGAQQLGWRGRRGRGARRSLGRHRPTLMADGVPARAHSSRPLARSSCRRMSAASARSWASIVRQSSSESLPVR